MSVNKTKQVIDAVTSAFAKIDFNFQVKNDGKGYQIILNKPNFEPFVFRNIKLNDVAGVALFCAERFFLTLDLK